MRIAVRRSAHSAGIGTTRTVVRALRVLNGSTLSVNARKVSDMVILTVVGIDAEFYAGGVDSLFTSVHVDREAAVRAMAAWVDDLTEGDQEMIDYCVQQAREGSDWFKIEHGATFEYEIVFTKVSNRL